jgi:competence protein ComEC
MHTKNNLIDDIKNCFYQEYFSLPDLFIMFFAVGVGLFFYLNQVPYIFISVLFVVLLILRQKILVFLLLTASVSYLYTYFYYKNHKVTFVNEFNFYKGTGVVDAIIYKTYATQIVINDLQFFGKHNNIQLNKIRLNVKDKEMLNNISIGSLVAFRSTLSPPPDFIIPLGYNFKEQAYFDKISGVGRADFIEQIDKPNNSYNVAINNIRNDIYNFLINKLGDRVGNFAAALMIGEAKAIPEDIAKSMRGAGISHILCVSGLHLSLVCLFFYISIRFMLNISNYIAFNFNIKKIAAIFAIILSFFYLLLTGGQVSAKRAFFMSFATFFAILVDKFSVINRIIMITLTGLLIEKPSYVTSPSFILSFSAVLSLINGSIILSKLHSYFYNNPIKIYSKITKDIGEYRDTTHNILFIFFARILSTLYYPINYFSQSIFSTFLASVVTAPFSVYFFYTYATYSVVGNLIAVPFTSFVVMPLALLSLFMYFVSDSGFLLNLLSYAIEFIIQVSKYVSNLQGSYMHIGVIDTTYVALYGFFLLLFTCFQNTLKIFSIIPLIICYFLCFTSSMPNLIINGKNKEIIIKDNDVYKVFLQKTSDIKEEFYKNWLGDVQFISRSKSEPFNVINLNNTTKLMVLYKNCIEDISQYVKADVIIKFQEDGKCYKSSYNFIKYKNLTHNIKSNVNIENNLIIKNNEILYCINGTCEIKLLNSKFLDRFNNFLPEIEK